MTDGPRARAMRDARVRRGTAGALVALGVSVAGVASGEAPGASRQSGFVEPMLGGDASPPWVDRGDVPVPEWARSVAPTKLDAALYAEPGRLDARRGSAQLGARLPLYATRRAGGCQGRWLNVGPLAWICSDVADYSEDTPFAAPLGTRPFELEPRPGARPLPPVGPLSANDDGLPYRYYFAGASGALGFSNLARALDDAPDQELERGFGVAVVEVRSAHGESWGRTKKGRWFALRELAAARPFLFHGERVDGKLDVAWVKVDRASVTSAEKGGKALGTRTRFEPVRVVEDKGALVRVEPLAAASGAADLAGWMRARDLAITRAAARPTEVQGAERWIDVDLAEQTLVAYEGDTPVFATIVSTGKGPPRSALATRRGVFRVWVKIFSTKMDNLDDDVERHYALEDVPWVQFFDKAIGLHGVFWHRDLGHVHSHGCVNLAPLDARWLFAFTAPSLPSGWTASYPTKIEPGAVVRVR